MQIQARIAAARGRTPEALSGFTSVIEFFDRRGMAVAPVARMLGARAEIHLGSGDTTAALADAERALRIARTLQSDNPHSSLTGLALSVLAQVHEGRGEHAEAQTASQSAVAHLTATLGRDHPETRRAQQVAAISATPQSVSSSSSSSSGSRGSAMAVKPVP
jgi:hypothetical protein